MAHWLFLPDDAIDDIRTLADFSSTQFERLRQVLEAEVEAKSYSLYLKIAESLGIPDQKAAGLYPLFDYVKKERSRNEKNGGAVGQEIERFLKGGGGGGGAEGGEAEKLLVK